MSSMFRLESMPAPGLDWPGVPPPLRAVCGGDPAILLDIQRPGIGLAIWAREPGEGWQQDMSRLRLSGADGRTGPAATVTAAGSPAAIARQVSDSIAAGCPAWFMRDVAGLAGLLCALAGTADLSARLGPAPGGEPPSGLRLCCRYGPGALCWSHPGADGGSIHGGRTDPFAVLLFKGAPSRVLRQRALRLGYDDQGSDPDGDARPAAAADPTGPTLCIETACPPDFLGASS